MKQDIKKGGCITMPLSDASKYLPVLGSQPQPPRWDMRTSISLASRTI